MLMLSSTLHNRPVLSLRSGRQIAVAQKPVIDPNNLKILGWWCVGAHSPGELVLLVEDVRESMPQGLAVNDESAILPPGDLVRHQEVLKIRFQLLDKIVKSKRHRLGRVSDFTYDESMFVQKIYVAKPLTKVFSGEDTLIIDRVQILEVTDSYILVDEADTRLGAKATAAIGATIQS